MGVKLPSVETVFGEAIEIVSEVERRAYLERACGGDAALRRQVESLLGAHVRAGDFLEGPGAPPTVEHDPSPPAEGPGAVIGPYKLLEQIGEGGMGVVYMAEQTHPIRRRVALKVIKPGMDSRQVIARFEAERQALALMDHPNIASVHDAGTTQSGRPYFVMELVCGLPITDYCDREKLPVPERLELIVLVCRAVQHAHQKGVIHRDLKPSNVLVTVVDSVPTPKVIDFGVAKAAGGGLTEGTLSTGFHQMVGTPLYMSPEQADLSSSDVDTRSDVYSLGVLLYELLTGSTPFDAETLRRAAFDEMRRMIREDEPPTPSARLSALGDSLSTVSARRGSDPRRLGRIVRGELDWIALKAMEKDRRRRYETANDFAADVMRYLTDRPVEACPPSVWYRLTKYARRNQIVLITMGLVAGALTAGTVLSTRQAYRATRAEHRTLAALAVSERNERINRRFWYGSQIRLIQQDLSVGHVEFAQEALEQLRPRPGEPDLRNFEWYYLHRLAHRDVSLLFGHESPVTALARSPDGSTLVSGDEYGHIVFWDLIDWRERARVHGHVDRIAIFAFSPDGRIVSSSTMGTQPAEVKLWDTATGQEVARLPGISGHADHVAFSPDGRTVSVLDRHDNNGVRDGRIARWELSAGPVPAVTELPSLPSMFLAVSPDRCLLATRTRSGEVTIREGSTGRAITTLPGSMPSVTWIAFTPDGHSLFTQDDRGMTFYDPATGIEQGQIAAAPGAMSMMFDVDQFPGLPLWRGGALWLTDIRSLLRPTILEAAPWDFNTRFLFSPDRRILAAVGPSLSATLWDTASGKKLAVYPRSFGQTLAISPRGDSLFVGCQDTRVRSWHIERPPDPLDHLPGHDKEVWALAYAPDGKTLASASDDCTIRLWDPLSGVLHQTLTGHISLVSSLVVSPDGSKLASGGFDGTVRLWDLPSGRPRAVLSGHTDRVRGVAFSPDGRLLASCSSDFTIRLWEVADGRDLATLRGHTDGLHDLAFDHDGTRLVSAGNDGSLRVWDVAGNSAPLTIPGPKANLALAFSRDGSLLASGSDHGKVVIWDTGTWTRHITIKGSDAAIRKLSFSPDGRTLATACDDARVRLWDPAIGQLTLVLDGHRARVNAVAFSPDGSTLASASHDGSIKLWSAKRP